MIVREQLENVLNLQTSMNPMSRNAENIFFAKISKMKYFTNMFNVYDLITKTRPYSFDPLKSHFYTVR